MKMIRINHSPFWGFDVVEAERTPTKWKISAIYIETNQEITVSIDAFASLDDMIPYSDELLVELQTNRDAYEIVTSDRFDIIQKYMRKHNEESISN